jgi:hypothetical protein
MPKRIKYCFLVQRRMEQLRPALHGVELWDCHMTYTSVKKKYFDCFTAARDVLKAVSHTCIKMVEDKSSVFLQPHS